MQRMHGLLFGVKFESKCQDSHSMKRIRLKLLFAECRTLCLGLNAIRHYKQMCLTSHTAFNRKHAICNHERRNHCCHHFVDFIYCDHPSTSNNLWRANSVGSDREGVVFYLSTEDIWSRMVIYIMVFYVWNWSTVQNWLLSLHSHRGLYSLSRQTSYCKILWSLKLRD